MASTGQATRKPTADPDRLGGLAWARRTGGALTGRERRSLIGALAHAQYENLLGRIKLATGRRPARAANIDVDSFAPPDSRVARDAEQACLEQPPVIVNHSYRTWMFGLALSALDRTDLDPELFYVASLLHDHGITSPTQGRCFTLGGAERAMQVCEAAQVDPAGAEQVGDAICAHITPGVSVARDGALTAYIQWGAMVDAAGLRIWDISPANVDKVIAKHPRLALKRELGRMAKAEVAAVPQGRFAFAARFGGLLLAVRIAPFKE
jgi:hypothetical protein